MRLAATLLLAFAALWAGAAQAVTYSYRSDTFDWETAANVVSWDRTCTGYPGDDDKATVTFTGGFTFRFAGTDYSSVRILSNGMLQFGADSGFHRNFTNTTLPAGNASAQTGCVAGPTLNTLMAYWTDLNPSQSGSGNVTWELKGVAPNRRFVVSWNGVFQYNTSTPYALQIVLYENGEFKYQYGNNNATGARATIGVQVNSSDFTLYSFNSGYNANGSAIRWFLASDDPARLAEYRFDEYAYQGRVGEVLDSSGNLNHGLAVGAGASNPSGAVCRALDVPANTGSTIAGVDTQVNASSRMGSAGGFSFWWRANTAWSNGGAAMLLDASGSTGAPVFIQRDSNGVLRFRITDSAGASLIATTAAQSFAAGTWVHIAASWRLAAGSNQSTLRLFINGSLVGSAVGTTSGSLTAGSGSWFVGDARLGSAPTGGTANSANGRIDELRLYNYDIGIAEALIDRDQTHACVPPLNRIRIEHVSGSGLTCTPSTLTLRACADAACTVPYVDGASGTLSGSGAVTPLWPDGSAFTIPAGQSSVNVRVQLPIAGSSLLAATAPSAAQSHTCNFGSPSCTFTAADAGFVLRLTDHRAESASSLAIEAVRRSDNSLACAPAFASVTRNLQLACRYLQPATGTLPVRLNGQALNASGSTGASCGAARTLPVSFDASGRASLPLLYADVGSLAMDASYAGSAATGDVGLTMTGSAGFIAAPADFLVQTTAASFIAGSAFNAVVTARNSSGATTPNFGQEGETVSLTFTRTSPTGAGAVNGVFSHGSLGFSNGVAIPTTLVWSEVGSGTLSAALSDSNYLGSGLAVTGSLGNLGPFRPHHFLITPTPACGSFTHAGQPFNVTVVARNGLGVPAVTQNYDGSAATSPNHARVLTWSDVGNLGLGTFSPTSWPASQFIAGSATSTLNYPFTTKQTAPQSLVLRATDSDGRSSSLQPSLEPSVALRSSRLVLQNAVGSASRALNLPLRVEYWSGSNWVLNSADTCTAGALTSAAVAQSGRVDVLGNSTRAGASPVQAITLASGVGSLRLAPPTPSGSGALDVAINLGSTAADRACLPATRPATTGANLAWLRSRQGSANGCGSREDSDPSSRASFGSIVGESTKRVHERQVD